MDAHALFSQNLFSMKDVSWDAEFTLWVTPKNRMPSEGAQSHSYLGTEGLGFTLMLGKAIYSKQNKEKAIESHCGMNTLCSYHVSLW